MALDIEGAKKRLERRLEAAKAEVEEIENVLAQLDDERMQQFKTLWEEIEDLGATSSRRSASSTSGGGRPKDKQCDSCGEWFSNLGRHQSATGHEGQRNA